MKVRGSKLFLICCLVLFSGVVWSITEGKPRKMQNIPTGVWGGQHIRIEVSNGSATVEYDCAHGTIAGPMTLDNKGKFSLTGTHAREGGPVRIDDARKGNPARFSGWTDGKKMTLSVMLVDSKQEIGTFELERGNQGRLRKCG